MQAVAPINSLKTRANDLPSGAFKSQGSAAAGSHTAASAAARFERTIDMNDHDASSDEHLIQPDLDDRENFPDTGTEAEPDTAVKDEPDAGESPLG